MQKYFTMNNIIIFANVTRIKIKSPRGHIQSQLKCWERWSFKSRITICITLESRTLKSRITTCTTHDFQKKRLSSTLPNRHMTCGYVEEK